MPLPIVYTAEDEDDREVVIDGQQRLTTFFAFLDGKWPRTGKPFKLAKLKLLPELNGKTFRDLPSDLQRAFRRYGVNIVKIGAGSNPNVKFEIFERLNTGAVTLSEQELRNCIYRGSLNDLLRRLADYDKFKLCIGTAKPLERMLDVELVLRFCAFYDRTYLNYNSKMKAFLNDYMNTERNMARDKLDRLEDAFKKACDNTYTVFGPHAFRRYSAGNEKNTSGGWEKAPNRAVFDVVLGWFARYERRQIVSVKDAVREEFIRLSIDDASFQDAITLGTTDVSRVRTRFELWGNTLKSIITTDAKERRLFSVNEKEALYNTNSTCGICGQKIVTIDDAEVDHIVPYAQGGPTDLSNARVVHRFCNRSRKRSDR